MVLTADPHPAYRYCGEPNCSELSSACGDVSYECTCPGLPGLVLRKRGGGPCWWEVPSGHPWATRRGLMGRS